MKLKLIRGRKDLRVHYKMGPETQSDSTAAPKKKSRSKGQLSARQILQLIAESLRRKVNFWIEDTILKDKIDHINVNIEEGEDNPELQMIEEMLNIHVK